MAEPVTPEEQALILSTRDAIVAAQTQHDAALQAVAAKLEEGDVCVLGPTPVPGVRKKGGKVEFGDIPPLVGG